MRKSAINNSSVKLNEGNRHSPLVSFLIRLVKEKPLGTLGGVITLLLLFVGIFANVLAPYGMNEVLVGPSSLAPSPGFWLGTDNLGRDMLSRVIYGARISVIIGLAATTVATIFATIVGITCGYVGGKFDMIVQRFVDTFLTFPDLLILMVIMSIVGQGMIAIIIVLGLWCGVASSRVIRGAAMSVKENVYVVAAEAIGCPTNRILVRHILPNVMAPIIVLYSVLVPHVILTEASLSFLGLGIPPPAPSWGGMLSGSGRDYMFLAPWMAIWPGLALAIAVYGINMFGDALRDLLDPRLTGGIGRYGVRAGKNTAKEVITGRRKRRIGVQQYRR